jgi:hypothetical protein
MASPRSKLKEKKTIHSLNKKGAKNFDKADNNKMKNFGDTPDSRPKGRALTPQLLESLKRLNKAGKRV